MKYEIKFDFDKNDIALTRGGNIELATGKTALAMRIKKALVTARNRYKIYFGTDYGNEIEEKLIGRSCPSEYLISEVERIARECISSIDGVSDVGSFVVSRDGDRIDVEFTVDTIYGSDNVFVNIS